MWGYEIMDHVIIIEMYVKFREKYVGCAELANPFQYESLV